MLTVTICIGNSDNKLTQLEWANFVTEIKTKVKKVASYIHFFGGSATYDPWQTVCWVIALNPVELDDLKDNLIEIRKEYKQDSIAISISDTELI